MFHSLILMFSFVVVVVFFRVLLLKNRTHFKLNANNYLNSFLRRGEMVVKSSNFWHSIWARFQQTLLHSSFSHLTFECITKAICLCLSVSVCVCKNFILKGWEWHINDRLILLLDKYVRCLKCVYIVTASRRGQKGSRSEQKLRHFTKLVKEIKGMSFSSFFIRWKPKRSWQHHLHYHHHRRCRRHTHTHTHNLHIWQIFHLLKLFWFWKINQPHFIIRI